MIKGITEFFGVRPGGVAKTGKIRSDQMIFLTEDGFQHGLIHAGRTGDAVEQKQHGAIGRPGFPIENIHTINVNCMVGNRRTGGGAYGVHEY